MKHLSGARVMQKNLVYITGLPFNLCDENVGVLAFVQLGSVYMYTWPRDRFLMFLHQILERKEYFGQYGKVLKVSISRAAGTSSQKTSTNNTFGM